MILRFRAWSKEREEMINDCDLSITSDGSVLAGDLNYDEESGMLADVTDNVVIMMSTGLKDKNGVEIYEGDIVQHSEKPNPFFSYPFKVIQARTGEWRLDNFRCGTVLAFSNQDELEVLGNIYENLELLEGE